MMGPEIANKAVGRENVAGRSLQQRHKMVIYFSREYTPHGETKMLYSHAGEMIDKPVYVVLTGGSRFPPANIPIHHPFRKLPSQPTVYEPCPLYYATDTHKKHQQLYLECRGKLFSFQQGQRQYDRASSTRR